MNSSVVGGHCQSAVDRRQGDHQVHDITLAILSGSVVAYWLVARFLPLFVVPEHVPGGSR